MSHHSLTRRLLCFRNALHALDVGAAGAAAAGGGGIAEAGPATTGPAGLVAAVAFRGRGTLEVSYSMTYSG